MDQFASDMIKKVWAQRSIPVLVRQGKGFPVYVKVPDPQDNPMWWYRIGAWLKPTVNSRDPQWIRKARGFMVPKGWFNDLTAKLLGQYGKLWIIQPYREQEVCAPACKNAVGHECNCSCMGQYHGTGGPDAGWFVVNEAFETRWGEAQMACRLMERTAKV